MRRLWMAAGNRVVQAIVGAMLVACLSGGWVALSALTSAPEASNALASQDDGQSTPAASPTDAADTVAAPTATARPRRHATDTPTGNGSTVALEGHVASVDQAASSFTLISGSTIQVDGNTSYGGQVHRLSDLQQNMEVKVTATRVQSGVYLASSVFVDN